MNSTQRVPTTAIQIRVTAPLRDRLEELRRSKRPIVPPLAALVKDLLVQALGDPPPK